MKYRVKLRRGEGWEVKPEAEQIDGKVFEFGEGWIIEEGDSSIYVGETAMIPRDSNWPKPTADDYIGWIASGDLEPLDNRGV